jgi:predicted MFS family arabinose efflux permease
LTEPPSTAPSGIGTLALITATVFNQGGVVLGSALGGLVVGLGGYHALAAAIAVGGALAASLATPLAWRRRG